MTPDDAVTLLREGIYLVMIMASVMILPSLLVGLIVSVFQAATQINEQTLSFFPRLLTTLAALALAGPWLINKMIEFSTQLAASIPLMIG